MSDYNINKIIEIIEEKAKNKKLSAAYNGGLDGGASILLDQVKFYKYGLNKEMPSEWLKYEKQLDPEYQEYLRLKNKFKDK